MQIIDRIVPLQRRLYLDREALDVACDGLQVHPSVYWHTGCPATGSIAIFSDRPSRIGIAVGHLVIVDFMGVGGQDVDDADLPSDCDINTLAVVTGERRRTYHLACRS